MLRPSVRILMLAITLLAAACGEPPRPAVEPVVRHVRLDPPGVAAEPREWLESSRAALGLSERDGFEVTHTIRRGGLEHVRLRQTHQGLPVEGTSLVVHVDGGIVIGATGSVAPSNATTTRARIDESAALATARAVAGGNPVRESAELRLLPLADGVRLAWHVELFVEGQAPAHWFVRVDAIDGSVVSAENRLQTLEQASGPGGNAKVARSWDAALDVEPYGSMWKMETAELLTIDMQQQTTGGVVVTGPLDPIADAAIDDAHGFSESVRVMLADWFAFDSIDGAGFRLRSRVHYGVSYENAFWDGAQMTYGDGASWFYPLSGAIDVVSHEIHHGFTQAHSGLVYSGQSGGMNESFSDLAGVAAEFHFEGDAADFELGEDVRKAPGLALRYLCDPTADGASIDHASDYVPGMDVHYSSGVMNKAFCRTARRLSGGSPDAPATAAGVRRAAAAWFEANASYWTSNIGFTEGCQGVADAARAMGYPESDLAAIRTSWAEVGVLCDGATPPPPPCDVTLTAESGAFATPGWPGDYPNGFTRTWCVQPASGNEAHLLFTDFATETGYDFVDVWDGDGTQLSHTSGAAAPPTAHGRAFVVRFRSDAYVTARGFRARWQTGANTAPSVAITSPAEGATVAGTITVTADASDAEGMLARVVFRFPDGTEVADTAAPWSASWNTIAVPDGSHEILVTAVDDLGSTATAARAVVVANADACTDNEFAAASLPLAIPDDDPAGAEAALEVIGTGAVATLDVSLEIDHTYRGDLRVELIAPGGTAVVLADREGGAGDDVVLAGAAVSGFAGAPAAGTWRLRVSDHEAVDEGRLLSWSVRIRADCAP